MDLSWLFGYGKISFHHSKKTVPVVLKSGKKVSLSDFCKERTPPCRLNPLLFNGHLQTARQAYNRLGPPIIYRRKIFESDSIKYPGSFAVDFVVHTSGDEHDDSLPERTTYYSDKELESLGSKDSKPMVVVLPGLSGGSDEHYLRQTLGPLVGERGWEGCVVNSRGCAKSKVTSNVLYNARSTWDVRQVVLFLREKFPNRPLYGIGFSIGANIMTNYIAEEGEDCLLKAVVACANPWNLDVSALALRRSWLRLHLYSKTMAASMKGVAEAHKDALFKDQNIDPDEFQKIKYLHEFDRVVQCPTWGYPTEGAYYRDASSIDSVFAIKIPFFAINAEDDPIATNEAIPYPSFKQNPYTVLCSTSIGGHLGWFEIGGHGWYVKAVVNFLDGMAREVKSHAKSTDPVPVHVKKKGYHPMRRPIEVPVQS